MDSSLRLNMPTLWHSPLGFRPVVEDLRQLKCDTRLVLLKQLPVTQIMQLSTAVWFPLSRSCRKIYLLKTKFSIR